MIVIHDHHDHHDANEVSRRPVFTAVGASELLNTAAAARTTTRKQRISNDQAMIHHMCPARRSFRPRKRRERRQKSHFGTAPECFVAKTVFGF